MALIQTELLLAQDLLVLFKNFHCFLYEHLICVF
jgi:hypothetical protein